MKPYVVYASLILLAAILRHFLRKTKFIPVAYVLPGLAMIWFLWNFTYPAAQFNDFNIAYYPAGRAIWDAPGQLYFPVAEESVRGFVNLPIVAAFFTPLSYLSRRMAQWIFTGLGAFAVIVFLIKMYRLTRVSAVNCYFLFAVAAMNGPLFYSLHLGNTTHFLLLLLLQTMIWLKQRRDLAAGALLALVVLIKLPFFLVPLYFGIRNRPRVLAAFMLCTAIIIAISIALFGFPLHLQWYERCIAPFIAKPLAAFNNQCVDGFLARLLTNGNAIHWRPVEAGSIFFMARYAMVASLLFLMFTAFRGARRRVDLEFCAILTLALLISPISWTHYYLLLLIPLAFLITNDEWDLLGQRAWLFAAITLSISAPVRIEPAYFNGDAVSGFLMTKLALSHYFFGGLLFFLLLAHAGVKARKEDQPAKKLVREQRV